MAFELAPLPYAFDALEPHIDAQTMEIHHGKHHAGYTSKLNDAIKDSPLADSSIEDILSLSGSESPAVRNNAGGFYNHNLFWNIMSPNGGGEPTGEIAEAINNSFASYEQFKNEFSSHAATRFGSGWAWLVVTETGDIQLTSTPNQDNPLMGDLVDVQGTPILGLDVWEHAYYLKYQNRRPDYIEAFFNVINWEEVNNRYKAAKGE